MAAVFTAVVARLMLNAMSDSQRLAVWVVLMNSARSMAIRVDGPEILMEYVDMTVPFLSGVVAGGRRPNEAVRNGSWHDKTPPAMTASGV